MANIPPELLDDLSAPLVDVYNHIENTLLNNIAKRFNTDKGMATTKWQIKKLAEIGKLTQENIEIIARNAGQVPEMTKIALENTAWEVIKELEPEFAEAVKNGYLNPALYPPQVSPSIAQALRYYQKQALADFNLVNTTMLQSSLDAYRKCVANTISMATRAEAQRIMNNATGEVVTGIASRQTALTGAIKQMANNGITAFYDKAGHAWSPEAYINMDIRTTMGNVATATTFGRCDDYAVDLIEISSHDGARPLCAVDQGKLYSRSGGSGTTTDGNGKAITYYSWKDTSYGEPAGILGINCGHFSYPFFAGMSFKRSEPTQNFAENDRSYQESQQQRALERNIRDAKREAAMQKAAGNTEAFENAAIKVKQQQSKLNNFISNTGRTARSDRTQVVGYDRQTAAQVTAAYNRANASK